MFHQSVPGSRAYCDFKEVAFQSEVIEDPDAIRSEVDAGPQAGEFRYLLVNVDGIAGLLKEHSTGCTAEPCTDDPNPGALGVTHGRLRSHSTIKCTHIVFPSKRQRAPAEMADCDPFGKSAGRIKPRINHN